MCQRRRPSPSLILSIVAVVLSLAGTSVAAINYARNAGAVDDKSAVGATSSRSGAAGKLVATAGSGPRRGQIPSRFLDLRGLARGAYRSFHTSIDAADSETAEPPVTGTSSRTLVPNATFARPPGFGTLYATCLDKNGKRGAVDLQATIVLTNTSGQTLNVARFVGGDQQAVVRTVDNTGQDGFDMATPNTFTHDIELNGAHVVVQCVFRQDGTATAPTCTIYGYTLTFPA
jgi:hypothetical protein